MTTAIDRLTEEQIEAFRRDGFVMVPDLLTPEERAHYAVEVDAAIAARKGHDTRPLAEKSRYEQSFIQCQNLWEDFPSVRPLTFHPLITEVAARLIGAERLRLWHDQALYKEPGGRLTDPHQDQAYWPIAETDTLTAWIPLSPEGSTLESGAMAYLPGSHRIGYKRFVNIFTGEPDDVLASQPLAGIDPVFVEVPPGGVAFHHGLTFHLARPNATDQPRRVHTAIYFRDGCTRAAKGAHPCVDRAGIAVGEVIASPVTPIAWPCPAGDLPDPPPPPEQSHGGTLPATGRG